MAQVLSRIVPGKKKEKNKNNVHVGKSAVISCFQMLSYTQLFWTEKPVTSCSTSLVTLTWSQSHLQKKKTKQKNKKINSCVYIYLTNVKGFFLFMWVLWMQNPLFWFKVNVFIYCSVNGRFTELCDLPCLCELCVRECVCVCVGWLHYSSMNGW